MSGAVKPARAGQPVGKAGASRQSLTEAQAKDVLRQLAPSKAQRDATQRAFKAEFAAEKAAERASPGLTPPASWLDKTKAVVAEAVAVAMSPGISGPATAPAIDDTSQLQGDAAARFKALVAQDGASPVAFAVTLGADPLTCIVSQIPGRPGDKNAEFFGADGHQVKVGTKTQLTFNTVSTFGYDIG
jgi:hypothetical protein